MAKKNADKAEKAKKDKKAQKAATAASKAGGKPPKQVKLGGKGQMDAAVEMLDMVENAYRQHVVHSNLHADLHRLIEDRIDCQYGLTVDDNNAFAPAEVARRSTCFMLDDVANEVAILWRDFEPDRNAPAIEDTDMARQLALDTLRAHLDETMPDIEAGVQTMMREWYDENRKPGCTMTPDDLNIAISQGLRAGHVVMQRLYGEIEQDAPCREYPDAASERVKAVALGWDIACKHMKAGDRKSVV